MKRIPVKEFQIITGLSDSLMWNLIHEPTLWSNKPDITIDPKHGLMIDVDSSKLEAILTVLLTEHHNHINNDKELIVDKLSQIIKTRFSQIMDKISTELEIDISNQER